MLSFKKYSRAGVFLLLLVLCTIPQPASARLRRRAGHCIPRKGANEPQQPLVGADVHSTASVWNSNTATDTVQAGKHEAHVKSDWSKDDHTQSATPHRSSNIISPIFATSHQASYTITSKTKPYIPPPSKSSSSNENQNRNNLKPCEISVYTYDLPSSCNKIYNEFGACGLSTYYPEIMSSSLPRLAVPMDIFDKYGKSQYNTLCGSEYNLSYSSYSFRLSFHDLTAVLW